MLYCQKLSAIIAGVPVWCAALDGHTGPCTWPENIPLDGNLRVTLPNGYNFRIDPVTGTASLEPLRT